MTSVKQDMRVDGIQSVCMLAMTQSEIESSKCDC